MSIFKRRAAAEPAGPVERPQVRQYRYVLRTAELPVLERLHREALAALDVLIRAHILRTCQDRTLGGREVSVDDVPQMARLLVSAEAQTPGIVVSALTDAALERLAYRVTTLPDAEPLLEGYADWDGSDSDRRLEPGRPAAAPGSGPEWGPESGPASSPVIRMAPQPSPLGAPRSLASQ